MKSAAPTRAVVLLLVVLAAALGCGVRSGGNGRGRGGGKRGPVAVEVAPVRKATIRDVGSFTGSLKPRADFVVAPKVAGRLKKLHVDIGDRVKNGQLIAELDDEEYAQKVEQARAELAVAKANVAQAESAFAVSRREHERVQALRGKRIASESELDASRAQHEAQDAKRRVAIAQVSERQAALKAAEIRLSYTRVRASWEEVGPTSRAGEGETRFVGKRFAGKRFVGERFVDEGALLAANSPIVSILDIRTLTAVIHVTEMDYSRVGVGQAAALTADAIQGTTFRGRIMRMAPLLKESSREARVEIELANEQLLLKPGMFVRARITFASHESATVVPLAAVARRGDRRGVFTVDSAAGTASFVPVETGIVEGELAEVVSPALSGLVVTMGQHLLEDGSEVKVSGEGAKPRPRGPGRPEGAAPSRKMQ